MSMINNIVQSIRVITLDLMMIVHFFFCSFNVFVYNNFSFQFSFMVTYVAY